MSFQTFFYHIASINDGASIAMDTPVRLVNNKVQVTFLGNISDRILQRMMRRKNPLVIADIKWIHREDFIDNID